MASFPLTDAIKNSPMYNGWNKNDGSIEADFAANGDSKYDSYLAQGGTPLSTDPGAVAIQQQRQSKDAQNKYQDAINTAVGGLQTQKTNLGQQYSDLLSTVKSEYDPLINSTTATAGAEEAKRGISPDSTLFQQQTQGALQPIYGAQAANAQQIGAGSIAATNTLTQAIAAMQSGAAGTSMNIPLQYGSLALNQSALPSQLALNAAQANQYNSQAKAASYVPTGLPGITFNAANNSSSLLGNNITMAQLQRMLGA